MTTGDRRGRWLAVVALGVVSSLDARAATLSVVDETGAGVAGYRWLLEEDTTHVVTPLVRNNTTVSTSIHKSHAPTLAAGTDADVHRLADPALVAPGKRYVISVLPADGATTLGAASFKGEQGNVTVKVRRQPLPPAQIAVLVFHDNQPINGAPDIPAEPGLSGFRIQVFDQAGEVSTDVFGNPLGTTYFPDGTVQAMGGGIFTEDWSVTNPQHRTPDALQHGRVIVKNLAPGKYGIRAIPEGPVKSFDGTVFTAPTKEWVQTSTIEGTPGIDAWVRSGEPPYFAEAGFFDVHAFLGFVLPQAMIKRSPTGVYGSIAGQAVVAHQNRFPQQFGLLPGQPIADAWVGINDLNAADQQIYAQRTAADGTFRVDGVPPGTYQLVFWDKPLDMIIDFRTVVVPAAGASIDLGKVPVYAWFGNLKGKVFHDVDRDGFADPGERGIPGQAVNLRFRDGSMYASTATDASGEYAFREVFPFFKWLVAEVDFARFEATGLTATVDDGGPLPAGSWLTPQPQLDENGPVFNPNTGDNLSRTEVGPSLLQAMLLYFGQTNVIDWGKAAYEKGNNGGISGIVYYDTTRAEDDPRFTAMEPWQPGIPRVRVNLYKVVGGLTPQGKPRGLLMVNSVAADSWDDAPPAGCKYLGLDLTLGDNAAYVDCAEIMQNWNQVRPGVFDGGYAFSSAFLGGIRTTVDEATGAVRPVLDADGAVGPNRPGEAALSPLPPGQYVVQVEVPPGYELVKEEDKNVDFGEGYTPALAALPPPCVGADRAVPLELSLFPGVLGAYAGQTRPLCDHKLVSVVDGQNTAADFALFTPVPKAGRLVGLITNDVMLEYSPTSPRLGDKLAPAWMPVSIKDSTGQEIARTYADEWGQYEVLVPGSYTMNVPAPSGVSPNMVTVCLNDLGDPAHPDPLYNPAYARPCTNWDVWPAKTTYIDTPVLPIAAMTDARGVLDCEIPVSIPEITRVDASVAGGPWLNLLGGARRVTVNGKAFGATRGTGRLELATLGGAVLLPTIVSWSDTRIVADVPYNASTGQLTVVNGAGKASVLGLTLHVRTNAYNPAVVRVPPNGSIQAALDAAPPGGLVLVPPGVYQGNLVISKPVKLQGYGARSVFVESGLYWTPEKQARWRARVDELVATGAVSLIDGERPDFFLEQGAGIMVLAPRGGPGAFNNAGRKAIIDGLTIFGAVQGGGVFVNAFARNLQISNNRIESNQGSFGGGIRVGTPSIVNAALDGYVASNNTSLTIRNNHVLGNGAIDGGGGIALFNGSDGYRLAENYVCGNFSLLYGGGVAHFGLSPRGVIERNTILFNEAFDEGGGLMLAGELPLQGGAVLSPGAGSVVVNRNLIQGNKSGDDGGGIRTLMFNGQDVARAPGLPLAWHRLDVLNNLVVNNVTADVGGGISLDDAARAFVIHNTVARNDSTATGVDAFGGPCGAGNPTAFCGEGAPGGGAVSSVPGPAGLSAIGHSAGLKAAFAPALRQPFPNPVLYDNVFWENRASYWKVDPATGQGALAAADPPTWDLGVVGLTGAWFDPRSCDLTSTRERDGHLYDASNVSIAPDFVQAYANVFAATSGGAAMGNFVTLSFGPLTPTGDYHLRSDLPGATSSYPLSVGLALLPLATDYDGELRSLSSDIGADEFTVPSGLSLVRTNAAVRYETTATNALAVTRRR